MKERVLNIKRAIIKKYFLLLLIVGFIGLLGCTLIEESHDSKKMTDSTIEASSETQVIDQTNDPWTSVGEFSVDMDGDQLLDFVTIEEQTVAEGYVLRVTGKGDTFVKVFPGAALVAESHLLDAGTYGHSLLVILNEAETANDSQEVRYYDEKCGIYIFDFKEGELVPLYVDGRTISEEGKYRFQLALEDETLQIQDSVSGMGAKFTLTLTEEQKRRLMIFDSAVRTKLLNERGFNYIAISKDKKEVNCEKTIYGVMHQDVFTKIQMVYTFVNGSWSSLEERMICDNPAVYLVQKTAPATQTMVWNTLVLDSYAKADLDTLLGLYHEKIDGAYAEGFASRLSVLYAELGVREILRGLGQVEGKNVKGIAKLLIGERLIEVGESGREELERDFATLLSISAMSSYEAKALQLVMEALDETSEWMK
jgi:hypothetical protein